MNTHKNNVIKAVIFGVLTLTLAVAGSVCYKRAIIIDDMVLSVVHKTPAACDFVGTVKKDDGSVITFGVDPVVGKWSLRTYGEMKEVLAAEYKVKSDAINIDTMSGKRYTDKVSGIRLDDIACK